MRDKRLQILGYDITRSLYDFKTKCSICKHYTLVYGYKIKKLNNKMFYICIHCDMKELRKYIEEFIIMQNKQMRLF